jgi:hypoxanthine-DNA glycosylase
MTNNTVANPRSTGFPPVARGDAKILILGSLPGQRSLEQSQYYAHERNAFWPIMCDLFGIEGNYEVRCTGLKQAGIALWDVLEAAVRPGSLDARIQTSDAQVNDFNGFFRAHKRIRCIAFNGRKAESLFQRRVLPGLDLAVPAQVLLPSTSPAYAALSYDKKLVIWRSMLVN